MSQAFLSDQLLAVSRQLLADNYSMPRHDMIR